MTVNHEIKSHLARLLATEDLVVEHKKVETACFNVHTRVLTLPMWEKASSTVYDLLVGHEVGHALETPDEDWIKDRKIPPQFVNVVEDVRVEKLMKRRYPGLAKTFYSGYKELQDQDFFLIGDDNVTNYNLADKVNLHFKVGNFLKIDFNANEQEIVDMIGVTETFEQVLDAAEVLYNFCKQDKQEESVDDMNSPENQTSGSSSNSGASDFENQEEGENDVEETDGNNRPDSDQGEQSEKKTSSEKTEKPDKTSSEGGETNDPEVKTMNSLEESLKNLVSHNVQENTYVEIPKLDLKQIIVSNKEIHDKCKKTWEENSSYVSFDHFDKQFLEFKRNAQKEVNYLVKEFECRKAADSYARATTARTGILDCSKLHTYKYNEDLFKKVTTLANGKNHGLVFILDWSGSMQDVMLDTIKQLYNLMWFCKKVAIPFEVYAFTNDYPVVSYEDGKVSNTRQTAYQKRNGLLQVCEWFSMMNLFTSKVNGKTLEEQMKNIFRVAKSLGGYSYPIPPGLNLSGTPLNEAMISLHEILPKFQKENKLQKVQCVVLTDGEGQAISYHKEFNRKWEKEPYLGLNSVDSTTILRDRKTGNTYNLGGNWWDITNILLRNLRDKFTDINFIGIRVLESRDSGSFIRRYCGYYGDQYNKAMGSWRKEGSFSLKNTGYHIYFGLSANSLSQNTEFSVSEDASKSQIKSAFVKSLKTKKMNKKVLGEFIELVA
jgi:Mg-chelatase subunit ChlD